MRRKRQTDDAMPSATSSSLRLSQAHAIAALAHEPGTNDAVREAQAAVFYLMEHLRPVLPAVQCSNDRESWIVTLTLIEGTLAFPGLDGLRLALSELNRGITADGLAAAPGGRRGGTSTTPQLIVMREIVESVSRIKEIRGLTELELDQYLLENGSSLSTFKGYKTKLRDADPSLLYGRSWLLTYGQATPEEVHRAAMRRLNALRASTV